MALWLYDVTGGVRIGKRHRRIDAGRGPGALPGPAHGPPGRRRSSTGTPRPTTPASPWRWPAPRPPTVRCWPTTPRRRAARRRTAGWPAPGWRTAPRSGPPGGRQRRRRVVRARSAGLARQGPAAMSIRPAKGIHVTVPAERLPCDFAVGAGRSRATGGRCSWCPGRPTRRPAGRAGTLHLRRDHRHRLRRPARRPTCTAEDVEYLLGPSTPGPRPG